MKKPASKIAHNRPKTFFFSIADHLKTSPNLIFCSIKMSPCATLNIMISLFRDKLEFVRLVLLDFFAFYVAFKCKIQPINV